MENNIKKEIESYKTEHEQLSKKLEELKSKKAVAVNEYKKFTKTIFELFPDLDNKMKPDAIIAFLKEQYEELKAQLETPENK